MDRLARASVVPHPARVAIIVGVILVAFVPSVQPRWNHHTDSGSHLAVDLVNAEALNAARFTGFLLAIQAAVLCTIGITTFVASPQFRLADPKKSMVHRALAFLGPLRASVIAAPAESTLLTAESAPVESCAAPPSAAAAVAVASASSTTLSESSSELSVSASSQDDDDVAAASAADVGDAGDLLFESAWHVLDGHFDGESVSQCGRLAVLESYQDFHRDWRLVADLADLRGDRFRRLCREEWSRQGASSVVIVRLPADTAVASSVWADIVLALVGNSAESGDALLAAIGAVDVCAGEENDIEMTIYVDVPATEYDDEVVRGALMLERAWPVEVHAL